MDSEPGNPVERLPRPAARQGGGSLRHPPAPLAKRALDIVMASLLLAAATPLIVIVAWLIRREDGGPVLFRQKRVGLDGREFWLLKFRSMRVDAEAETGPVWAQANDPRVTRVGRWTRRFHVDEIPQVWNVLRGEMSFVGPRPERPELMDELRREIPGYTQRHAVPPGITGWAQVNYRYASTVDDARRKLAYDLDYVRNASVMLDLAIIAATIKIVLFRA